MKKIIYIIFSLLIIHIISLTAFAGSIDIDLINNDDALVFIGSVDDYTITDEEEDYPNTEYSVKITPCKKIKGNVVTDKAMNFDKVRTGKLKLQKNTNYLFGYMSDELYIWELEYYEGLFDWELDDYTKDSIILKERHNDTISGGMQKLLNEGAFELAEKERQNHKEQIASIDFTDNSNTVGIHSELSVLKTSLIICVLITLTAVCILCFRKNFLKKADMTKKEDK